MNKIIKKGLLSVALLATVVAQATSKIVVKSSIDKKVEISVASVEGGEVLSIIDTKDEVLFSEHLEKGNWLRKTFDFSTAPEGIYFIQSKGESKIEVTPVIVAKDKVTVLDESKKVYKAPSVKLDDRIAKVLINNFNKSEVKLTIIDEAGEEIYTIHNKDLVTYNAFNFDKLPAGSYTIVTKIADYSFEDTIALK